MADIRDTEIAFRPLHESPIKVTVAGKKITVCCDECVEKAKENPAQYAA